MVDVSIIIINYNTVPLTERCIASIIERTSGIDYEIILIDNNSSEPGVEAIISKFGVISFIQLNENIGFGRACNHAAVLAKGKFLLFLNPDTCLQNNAVKMMLDFFIDNGDKLKISCLGPQLTDSTGNPAHSAEQFPVMKNYVFSKTKSLLRRFSLQKNESRIQKCAELYCKVDYVTGAAMMIKKSLFDEARGFDSAFFLYFEETDLQYRLAAEGGQSYVLNGPSIAHVQGASTEGQSALLRSHYYNSMHVFFKKHNPKIVYFMFAFIWFFLDIKTVFQLRKFKNQRL